MRQVAVLLSLGLALGAFASPQIETVDLQVGQRVELTVEGHDAIRVANENVVKATATDPHTVSLVAHGVGKTLVSLGAGEHRRTLLVRVQAGAQPLATAHAVAAAPVGPTLGPARPQAGLVVFTQVDKPRAVPDDVVTYTVLCRNLGPGDETGVVVEARPPEGLEVMPDGLSAGARWTAEDRRIAWEVPVLQAKEQSAFSFRARVAVAEPGARIETSAQVQSAAMPRPRGGEPVVTEVVAAPLLAAFAVPDVILAQAAGPRPLIDIESTPGERLVRRLEALGVVSGYPDGTFRPSAPVTRAEATKMLVAVQQLTGIRDRASISVALSRPAKVTVTIEDGNRRAVRRLADGWELSEGTHQLTWDARDDEGRCLPMGVYRYEARAEDSDGISQVFDGTLHLVSVQPLPAELETSFRDVPADAWYHRYVALAEERGIVRGYPGGLFLPNAPIRRVENTVMVVRAAGLGEEAEKRMNASLGFADAADVPRWAIGYVAVATSNGPSAEGRLLIGYHDNRFLPQQNLVRAEAAAVLERLLDHRGPLDIPASGRIARGHSVEINGRAVTAGENGRFREPVRVEPDLDLVRVAVR